MGEPSTFWCDFVDEVTGYAVVFEDDGLAAFAYLLDPGQEIVGDVWLYNRGETPGQPEWSDPDNLPCPNPSDYAKDHAGFRPVTDASEIAVSWDRDGRKLESAHLFLRGEAFAVLAEGAKPGWCVLAKKDGPLAKTLIPGSTDRPAG